MEYDYLKTELPSKTPTLNSREYYSNKPMRREVYIDLWINSFWNLTHIMAITYDPARDSKNLMINATTCFYEALSIIVPNNNLRQTMSEFIKMTPNVKNTLIENKDLKSFFSVYPTNLDSNFLKDSLESSEKLFIWSYLFHSYYNIINNQPISTFNYMKQKYDPATISKETWANPLWAMGHYCAIFAPEKLPPEWCKAFKAFISCLRYTIPCPVCRKHLQQNLSEIDIDQYLSTRDSIFDYTVKLHNLVNKMLNKPILSLEEARKIYDPYNSYLVKQNIGY